MNRIGKKTAYSKLVKNVDILSKLKTFHQDDQGDSVDVARTYALLLYGKKGEDDDTLDQLCYIIATRRSVEHCTPHADGVWLNELGWSQ